MQNFEISKNGQRIIGSLLSFLFFICSLDALLYWTDPLGVVQRSYEQATTLLAMQVHPSGYQLPEGVLEYKNHNITILEDSKRYLPDTNIHADCKIAFIGDSVTINMGVADADAWPNLVARDFDNVHFINVARGDYSAYNIYLLMQMYSADGYIWLMIENDIIEPYHPMILVPLRNPYLPASRLYYFWLRRQFTAPVTIDGQPGRPVNLDQYWQYADAIMNNDNVIGFALDRDNWEYSKETANRYENMTLINHYSEENYISNDDAHPNPAGNYEIYQEVIEPVTTFVQKICAD